MEPLKLGLQHSSTILFAAVKFTLVAASLVGSQPLYVFILGPMRGKWAGEGVCPPPSRQQGSVSLVLHPMLLLQSPAHEAMQ